MKKVKQEKKEVGKEQQEEEKEERDTEVGIREKRIKGIKSGEADCQVTEEVCTALFPSHFPPASTHLPDTRYSLWFSVTEPLLQERVENREHPTQAALLLYI